MKTSSIRNFGSIRCRVLESSSECGRNRSACFSATLDVLDFSGTVNKLPLCTPERHLKHHVNLTINNDKYGGPQLPHQNQMHTANYKSLTANSNRSQQIQIAHSELQITHSKLQIAHSKLQIAHSKLQIAHSKFKWPTANSNRSKQIQESAFLSRVEGITLTLTLTLTVTTNLRPVHPSAFDLQPCADLFT